MFHICPRSLAVFMLQISALRKTPEVVVQARSVRVFYRAALMQYSVFVLWSRLLLPFKHSGSQLHPFFSLSVCLCVNRVI